MSSRVRMLGRALLRSWFVAFLFAVFAAAIWIQLGRLASGLLRQGGALSPWLMTPLGEAREELGTALGITGVFCWLAYVGYRFATDSKDP